MPHHDPIQLLYTTTSHRLIPLPVSLLLTVQQRPATLQCPWQFQREQAHP